MYMYALTFSLGSPEASLHFPSAEETQIQRQACRALDTCWHRQSPLQRVLIVRK